MGRFVANPDVLRAKGTELISQADLFAQNVNTIYENVHKMVNTDYLSPEAKAIANEIETYKDDFNKMAKVISDYGKFCLDASNKVLTNQDNIISGI